MEQPIISGVAHDRSEAKITVVGVPDKPGEAAAIFRALAEAEINIDMIVQNMSSAATGRTDITFTCPKTDAHNALAALDKVKERSASSDRLRRPDRQGLADRRRDALAPRRLRDVLPALADAGVNVELISTSEIRISRCVPRAMTLDDAVRAVHTAFELDAESGEAVVYGGTGR